MPSETGGQETRIFFGSSFMRLMAALLIVLVILMAAVHGLELDGHPRHSHADAIGNQLDRIGIYSESFIVLAVAAFLVIARRVPAYRMRSDQLVCTRGWRPLTITRSQITASRLTPSTISIFTAGGASVTIWRKFLNPSDAALISEWLKLAPLATSPPAEGAAAPAGNGILRRPLTSDVKFIIVAAVIALSVGLAVGVCYFSHEMALLNAHQHLPFDFSQDAKPGAAAPDHGPAAAKAKADKAAIHAAYRSGTTHIKRHSALLDLTQAIRDSHEITDEDRSVLKDFMSAGQTDREAKVVVMLPVIELEDRGSFGWLIEVAMAEKDDEWRRRVVRTIMSMDREAALATVAAKLAHDERYRNVQLIVDEVLKERD